MLIKVARGKRQTKRGLAFRKRAPREGAPGSPKGFYCQTWSISL